MTNLELAQKWHDQALNLTFEAGVAEMPRAIELLGKAEQLIECAKELLAVTS